MANSLVEQIADKVAALPLAQQREALALIEALEKHAATTTTTPRSSRLKGATVGPGPRLTLAALREARKEMWGETGEGEQ